MIETPELDKQRAIIESGQTDTLTHFVDWLADEGFHICEYVQFKDEDGDDEGEPQLTFARLRNEQLFARFFGIDLDKIEAERRAVLDAIRKIEAERRVVLDAIRKIEAERRAVLDAIREGAL